MQAAETVRSFLIDEKYWAGPRAELTEDVPLIADRVIDSMGLLRLVAWLEDRFGISISHAEVVPSNFGTIGSIAQLVEGKLNHH